MKETANDWSRGGLRNLSMAPTSHPQKIASRSNGSRLAGLVSTQFGGAPVHVVGRKKVRSNSEVYRGVVGTADQRIVAIKRCFMAGTEQLDPAEANDQYLGLQTVSDAGRKHPDQPFRVPDPICIFPDEATYVMDWIDGASLTDRLRRPSLIPMATKSFEGVGKWLGNFHRAGPLREHAIDISDRIALLDELIDSPILHPVFRRGLETAKALDKEFATIRCQASWLHGDCKTDNFLLTENEVFGIDVSLKFENPVEYDAAQFLNNLRLLASHPLCFYLNPFLDRFEQAFFEGYDTSGISFSRRYLVWLRLTLAVSLWDEIVSKTNSRLRIFFLNGMFSRLVDHLIKLLDPDV